MGEQVVTEYLEDLSHNSPAETEENHENPPQSV
jgi:hypothetical protein